MNEKIAPFANLSAGGRELAAMLPRDAFREVLVLAIVSAGVPGAVEVAKHLNAPLDLITFRRLLTPQGPGTQACAANVAGTFVVDEEIGPRPAKPETPFDFFAADAMEGLARRVEVCRGNRPPIDLAGKHVLIFDCAIRTSFTLEAAVKATRKLHPARVTAAVPVTSAEGRQIAKTLADEFIYLAAPEPFGNAGVWYKDFGRLADDRISEVLR